MQALRAITIGPTREHFGSVIFLHGLGDTGAGWSDVAAMLSRSFPTLRFILPTAYASPTTTITHPLQRYKWMLRSD